MTWLHCTHIATKRALLWYFVHSADRVTRVFEYMYQISRSSESYDSTIQRARMHFYSQLRLAVICVTTPTVPWKSSAELSDRVLDHGSHSHNNVSIMIYKIILIAYTGNVGTWLTLHLFILFSESRSPLRGCRSQKSPALLRFRRRCARRR